MTAHLPPVPPAARSGKGTGESPRPADEAAGGTAAAGTAAPNTAEQAQQGNVHQNTTHKGHQQDR